MATHASGAYDLSLSIHFHFHLHFHLHFIKSERERERESESISDFHSLVPNYYNAPTQCETCVFSYCSGNNLPACLSETNLPTFIFARCKFVYKLHRVCHAHWAWGRLAYLTFYWWSAESRLATTETEMEMRCTYLILQENRAKSPYHAATTTMAKTRHLPPLWASRYPAMACQVSLFSFCIFPFRFFFFFCHLRQLLLWQIEAQSRKVFLIMSVSEMILATFTFGLILVVVNAAMSMLMAKLLGWLCACSIRRQTIRCECTQTELSTVSLYTNVDTRDALELLHQSDRCGLSFPGPLARGVSQFSTLSSSTSATLCHGRCRCRPRGDARMSAAGSRAGQWSVPSQFIASMQIA